LAAAQLGRYLDEHSPDPDAPAAAANPAAVTRAHVEAFQAWMISTRSASTALNKHKPAGVLQVRRRRGGDGPFADGPRAAAEDAPPPHPVICDDDTKRILDACRGRDFASLRDEAIIRLLYNTGARLAEVGNLMVDDVDLDTESVHYTGKGSRDRRVRFGAKTARAISRYLRARAKHRAAALPNLWLARAWHATTPAERHQDPATAPRRRRGRARPARASVAPQLRPRVETGWWRHR
jgi:integrase/recombinase XerC